MKSIRSTAVLYVLALFGVQGGVAHAQVSASAQGEADIEAGANQASDIETGAGARNEQEVSAAGDGGGGGGGSISHGGGDGLRIAIQGRLDAINTLALADPGANPPTTQGDLAFEGRRLLVPIVTPGVRLLEDHRLFLGAGFGFAGVDDDPDGPGEASRSGWSFSPLVSYDLLVDESAALGLLGWLNLASLSESETCGGGGCEDQNDDGFGWGLSLGANLRGLISPGLALGAEFGWGFLDISYDPDDDGVFVHGVFGNIFLEASIGI